MLTKIFKSLTILSLVSLVLTSFAFLNVNGYAQTQNRGLVISPAIYEIEADRGNNYSADLTIENDDESSDYTLSTSTETFQASNTEGTPELRPFNPNEPQRNWVTFADKRFELKKGDKKSHKVQVSIPSDAKPGGYYFALIITNENSQTSDKSKVLLRERISSLLFINVKGQVQRSVAWEAFATDKDIYDPLFDPIDLSYKIGLKGQGYLKPTGSIYIQASDNNNITNLPLNSDQKIILPDSTRSFNIGQKAKWNVQGLTNKDLNTKYSDNSSDFNLPLFGKYTIQAKLVFVNSQGDIETKTVSKDIFVFPWKLGLIILVFLVILGLILFFIIKNINKNKKESVSKTKLQS